MEKRKIAFIPGAFRPFGDHHMRMVRHYSDMCDEVVIVISNPSEKESERKTNLGTAITPWQSKAIIDLCLADYGMENVRSEVGADESPIRTAIKDIMDLRDCEVVLGVGAKGDDPTRFDFIKPEWFEKNGVTLIPPSETVFDGGEDESGMMSATDIRGHIDDRDMLRTYLPVGIGDDTFSKICDILSGKVKPELDTKDELRRGSQIFQELLEESANPDGLSDGTESPDEEDPQFPNIHLDDATLSESECWINAYNTQVSEDEGDDRAYTPKNFPDKAIDLVIDLDGGDEVEIYLDTDAKEWDSRVNGAEGKLSPDQMGEFFRTDFCRRLGDRVQEMWPSSDPFFQGLLEAVKSKKVSLDPIGTVNEDGEFRKGNIDKSKSREKNAAGEQIYTNSGRKIVTFSDFGVKHTADEAYYVFPEKGKEFKWSQWADWKKNHVLARARIQHNSYLYGLSLSMFEEDDKNRGFRAYNLDLDPKLQYLTPIETQQMLDLSVIQKFLRKCIKRLNKLTQLSAEEIYERVGRPDKCTLDDVRKTLRVVKNTMKAIRDRRADTYIYT